ncbi:MAG: MBOAT family protein [Paludibacteraceae bacterium]|nr:MBOAT family protein [Paludibacteraceae bacterium]
MAKSSTLQIAKAWTAANIVLNLAILAVFKYYDFFVREFGQLFGISTESLLLRIILPVGISFYTFQALSYSIDVYRKKIEPTRDIVAFFAYVAFFPQLVAGPIERATNLLPQFQTNRKFSYNQAVDGMRQILWGLFKKIVVADNCATYVDQVWATYNTQTGSTLLLAAILFTFQIYGDFSGYSDIAIGTAKLFGIKLMRNFNNPYFSRDIAEFWRRWHISLTTWFRDYVYIPLGGSRPEIPAHIQNPDRYKKLIIIRNTFVIFLLSGFWHGANWTFIAWGAYHAILFLPLILLGQNRKYTNQVAEGRLLPSFRESFQILLTFMLAVLGWIIFRAPHMPTLLHYLEGMLQWGTLRASYRFFLLDENLVWPTNFLIIIMVLVEWFQRNKQHGLEMNISRWYIRYAIYLIICGLILYFCNSATTFIYFQF